MLPTCLFVKTSDDEHFWELCTIWGFYPSFANPTTVTRETVREEMIKCVHSYGDDIKRHSVTLMVYERLLHFMHERNIPVSTIIEYYLEEGY
jgi:hypothetical protein